MNSFARTRLRLAAIAAALALIVVIAGCGSSEPVIPPSQIANAAYESTHGSGFKYAISISASAQGQSIDISGHGAIDSKSLRGTMSMGVEGTTVDVRFDNPYIYIRKDNSGPWLRVKSDVYQQAQQQAGAGGVSGQATSDPSKVLEFLKSAESVNKVGSEDVNGTPTTHYRAQVDFAKRLKTVAPSERSETQQFLKLVKASQGNAVLPVDVYVDAHKRVRRMSFKVDLCTTEGDVSVGLKFDFLSYGPQELPGLPRGEEVRDATDEFKNQANSTDLSQYSC